MDKLLFRLVQQGRSWEIVKDSSTSKRIWLDVKTGGLRWGRPLVLWQYKWGPANNLAGRNDCVDVEGRAWIVSQGGKQTMLKWFGDGARGDEA